MHLRSHSTASEEQGLNLTPSRCFVTKHRVVSELGGRAGLQGLGLQDGMSGLQSPSCVTQDTCCPSLSGTRELMFQGQGLRSCACFQISRGCFAPHWWRNTGP